jgi:FkbM family methyltransferase
MRFKSHLLRDLPKALRRARRRAKFVWRNRDTNALLATLRVAVLHGLGLRRRVRFEIAGHPVILRTGTPDLEVARSCLTGEFDEALACIQDPRGLFIDAGAYIGTAALAFAARFPESEIICLEPSPDNYSVAVANTAHLPNVRVLNVALAERAGESTLRARATGEWGHTLVPNPADCATSRVVSSVSTVGVEDLLAQSARHRVELLKLDIEGGEFALFNAPTDWLAHTHVIVAELHDKIVPGCEDVFLRANAGRTVWRRPGVEKFISVA